MIKGTAKFDGIAVGELSANFLNGTGLSCKAAFINSTTGHTHGWTNGSSGWSKATLAKLQELRALMEADLAETHFANPVGGPLSTGTSQGPGEGLGEFLQAGQGSQV